MTISFVTRLSQSHEHDTIFITGCDYTGKTAWYILKLHKRKAPLFDIEIAKGLAFNLSDYGQIIDSGYGTPPQALAA